MTEVEFYVVELAAECYQHTPDGANEHSLAVPIVAGPFDTQEAAIEWTPMAHSTDGYAVVSIPEGDVPDDALAAVA